MLIKYIEQFCENNKPLSNQTSYAENDTYYYPRMSLCIEQSFSIWIPCFLLWLFAPFWLHMLKRKKYFELRANSCLLWTKNVSIALQIVNQLVYLIYLTIGYNKTEQQIQIYSCIILVVSFVG